MLVERTVKVSNKYGLHARASTRLAQLASQFSASVLLVGEEAPEPVDATSIIEVMSMGAENGQDITIRVEGEDAEVAIEAIVELFQRKFDED